MGKCGYFTLLTGVPKLHSKTHVFCLFFGGDEKGKVEIFREHKGGGETAIGLRFFVYFVLFGEWKAHHFFWTICCIFNFSKKPKTNTKDMEKRKNLTIITKKRTPILFNTLLFFFWLRFACSVVGQKYNIFSQIGGETW